MILAVDPGQTTGMVLVKGPSPSELLAHLQSENYDPQPVLAMAGLWHPLLTHVVIERPPAQGNDRELLVLHAVLVNALELLELNIEHISPGHWKPVFKQLSPPVPKGLSIHERDAWAMAYVSMRNRSRA